VKATDKRYEKSPQSLGTKKKLVSSEEFTKTKLPGEIVMLKKYFFSFFWWKAGGRARMETRVAHKIYKLPEIFFKMKKPVKVGVIEKIDWSR
jgi:hypothetical protein